MLTNLFISLGWSRDDLKWIWLQLVALAGIVSSNVFDVPYWMAYLGIPLSPTVLHWIFAIAAFVLWLAGKYNVSPLPSARAMESGAVPGSPAAPKIGAILLAGLLAGTAWSCASLPVKQRAVVGLSASETALEAAHDAERSLCSPTADKTQPIRHCDGPTAAAMGLTDARHQQIAGLFSRAFQTQIAAATAVKFWRAGAPPPSTLAEYQRDLSDLLTLISATVPATQAAVAKVQAAVDQAAKVAAVLGVK